VRSCESAGSPYWSRLASSRTHEAGSRRSLRAERRARAGQWRGRLRFVHSGRLVGEVGDDCLAPEGVAGASSAGSLETRLIEPRSSVLLASGVARGDNARIGTPSPPAQKTGQAALTGVALLVAPLLAAMGALAVTGVVGRVQRDHPSKLSWALGLVLAAGALWVLGSVFRNATVVRVLHVIAVLLAFTGFVLALVAAVATANDQSRPQITASLGARESTLTATISAGDLATKDRVAIEVDALTRNPDVSRLYGDPFNDRVERVYRAYVGPDNDGRVTHKFTIGLPGGGFTDVGIKAYTGKQSPTCDDLSDKQIETHGTGSGTACVTIRLDNPAPRGR